MRDSRESSEGTKTSLIDWTARLAFALPFAWNLQCIITMFADPTSSAASFHLSGDPGTIAIQGLAVAFLMWNATYPPVICAPRRFKTLGIIVAIQQVIGLVGETTIYLTLPAGETLIAESIGRFMLFDAAGLVLMAIALVLLWKPRRGQSKSGE